MGSRAVQKHIEALQSLKGKTVEAGWFETARYPATGTSSVGIPVAEVARIQEFGAVIQRGDSTITIPARPFMRLAYANFLKDRHTVEKSIAKKMFEGTLSADGALGQIGLFLEGCIVESIKNGNWQPNSEATIAKKGFDKPLIDTAHMWQTVASKVVK